MFEPNFLATVLSVHLISHIISTTILTRKMDIPGYSRIKSGSKRPHANNRAIMRLQTSTLFKNYILNYTLKRLPTIFTNIVIWSLLSLQFSF